MLCFDAAYKMADISLIQDVCMDDCDEGVYEQGDCSTGSPSDDDVLPPLSRVQRYAQSANVYDRQMVVRVVQELFRTAPVDLLTEEIPNIMNTIRNLGEKDEAMVRADLLDQIPHMAHQAVIYSYRVEILNTIISEYLLPLIVRNLGSSDNTVDKAAQGSLFHLLDQGLISKPQVEIQVCPAILALSYEEQTVDINTGAITLMSKLAPLLGRDVVERVFLKRFSELCTSHMFYVRKVCASHIGDFCAVVGKEQFEKVLLPCYITLCQDDIWGVRKSCAEVVMFVSLVCLPEVRRGTLAPVFAKLLQDDYRWVQMSAFQTLGPFISTFADPAITSATYNSQSELVFINKNGDEFLINSPAVPDGRFCKYRPKQMNRMPTASNDNSSDWWGLDEDENKLKMERDCLESITTELDSNEQIDNTTEADNNSANEIVQLEQALFAEEIETEKDKEEVKTGTDNSVMKEMVKIVKNAVLSCQTTSENAFSSETASNDENVISDIKGNETCDSLDAKINELANNFDTITIKDTVDDGGGGGSSSDEIVVKNDESEAAGDASKVLNNDIKGGEEPKSDEIKQVNNSKASENEDDLELFNSYHYWYISPEVPLDLNIVREEPFSKDKFDVIGARLENMYSTMNLNDVFYESRTDPGQINFSILSDINSSADITDLLPVEQQNQDIVPEILISHFMLMTDSRFAVNIDVEMSYHCAYSLPAVAMTLENKNWPLLKRTIERLAGDMQYKVRRTVASSLHELALIFGRDIATEHLTPIFDGFIKDLDEVRIGILKHLAYFLRLIKPAKRLTYLPRLHEFLKTENEWNWRFRWELGKQLLFIVTLFRPVDALKHIGLVAEVLLHDVAAVRQVAISLIGELLRHVSTRPGLNAHFLVRLVEKFAHSKKWKRRQTFALLCYKLLVCKALPADQFASDIMPHLLDLSWDPVANVRLVVAKTIAQHVIEDEYFSDPSNQYFDSLGTVLRRLQADKDRDVRQYAEVNNKRSEKPDSPIPSMYFNID